MLERDSEYHAYVGKAKAKAKTSEKAKQPRATDKARLIFMF